MHPHSNVSNVAVILKLNIRILFELRKYSAGKTGQNILIWVTTRWKKTINYKVKSPIFYFCRIMSLSGSTSDCICIFNPLLATKTLKLTLRNAATTILGFYFFLSLDDTTLKYRILKKFFQMVSDSIASSECGRSW